MGGDRQLTSVRMNHWVSSIKLCIIIIICMIVYRSRVSGVSPSYSTSLILVNGGCSVGLGAPVLYTWDVLHMHGYGNEVVVGVWYTCVV